MSAPASIVLGEFAASLRETGLPAQIVEKAKCHLLYNLACGLAACDSARPVWGLVEGSGPAEATLIARGGRVPAELAAFANGVLLHGRAQDDTHLASQTHPGTVVIPAALAVAESTGAGPSEFLAGHNDLPQGNGVIIGLMGGEVVGNPVFGNVVLQLVHEQFAFQDVFQVDDG